jgi:hypothetical protein
MKGTGTPLESSVFRAGAAALYLMCLKYHLRSLLTLLQRCRPYVQLLAALVGVLLAQWCVVWGVSASALTVGYACTCYGPLCMLWHQQVRRQCCLLLCSMTVLSCSLSSLHSRIHWFDVRPPGLLSLTQGLVYELHASLVVARCCSVTLHSHRVLNRVASVCTALSLLGASAWVCFLSWPACMR